MTKTSIYKTETGKAKILNFYENLLDNWHKPFEKRMIQTKYGETFIVESGKKTAPAVVLLHGSSSNSAMWMADVKQLSENRHVFAVDIIGECGKSAESRPDFKGNHYSDWLREIFGKLNLKRAAIVGCSLGGWIATDFAMKHPAKVGKLVLLATAGISQVKLSTVFWILVTSVAGDTGFRKLNRMVYGNEEIDQTALQFASLIKAYFKPRTNVLPIFTDEQLNNIQADTFFIGGENDCFYNSKKTASRLSKHIRCFKCDIPEKTGHVLINQTGKIINFIDEH